VSQQTPKALVESPFKPVIQRAMRYAGNLLIAGSVLGLLGLGLVLLMPESAPGPSEAAGLPAAIIHQAFGGGLTNSAIGRQPQASAGRADAIISSSAGSSSSAVSASAAPQSPRNVFRPITHLSVPAIDLDADVVPASLVPLDGGVTWEVPAFKVGHAQGTASAGQPGNAVLLGHVTSVHSGNVFQDLDHARIGDVVNVFADDRAFEYRVVSTVHVPRSDSSVLEQGDTPAVSLITCTGFWLPIIWDYTERLVVRAELSSAAAQ
jgi:LPXTG-site transpeptidase (sortase) family protein